LDHYPPQRQQRQHPCPKIRPSLSQDFTSPTSLPLTHGTTTLIRSFGYFCQLPAATFRTHCRILAALQLLRNSQRGEFGACGYSPNGGPCTTHPSFPVYLHSSKFSPDCERHYPLISTQLREHREICDRNGIIHQAPCSEVLGSVTCWLYRSVLLHLDI
jgi:hypothetical protein